MPIPASPSIQITTKAANDSSTAKQAIAIAPPSVASAGRFSSMPERTMMTAMNDATNAKPAVRRAQMASFEVGSSWT